MKIKRRILASLLVLVLCLSLTITAFAASKTSTKYGTITGTTTCREVDFCAVATTSVTKNNVGATLGVQMKFYNTNNGAVAYSSKSSNPGVLSFSFTDSYVDHISTVGVFTATNIQTVHSVTDYSSETVETVTSYLTLPA